MTSGNKPPVREFDVSPDKCRDLIDRAMMLTRYKDDANRLIAAVEGMQVGDCLGTLVKLQCGLGFTCERGDDCGANSSVDYDGILPDPKSK